MRSTQPDPSVLLNRHPSNRDFDAMVKIHFEQEGFLVRTADTFAEREQAFALRADEFAEGQTSPDDAHRRDSFDAIGEHLLLIDTKRGKAVGTYRLISSECSRRFHAAGQFVLDGFSKVPGVKVELSRGCFAKGYRTATAIKLLWRGISAYASCVNADYIFGTAPVSTTNELKAALLCHYLSKLGLMCAEFGISPMEKRLIPGLRSYLHEIEGRGGDSDELARSLISPFLNAYLRAGAKICGEPALDSSAGCIRFLAIIPTELAVPVSYRVAHGPNSATH